MAISLVFYSSISNAFDRLTVNHNNIDIRSAIPLVAEFCNANVVLGQSIEGNISLNFDDVPCSQAFDILIKSNNLQYQLIDDVYVVTQNQSDDVLKIERSNKDLNVFRRDLSYERELERRIIPIIHANAEDVVSVFRDSFMINNIDGVSMTVDKRTNSIFAALPASFFSSLEQVINVIDVPVRQVVIEATIVEASVDWSRRLGLNWNSSLNLGNFALGSVGALGGVGSSFNIGFLSNSFSLDSIFYAMENEGKGHVLSKPKLLTLDRTTASVSRGTEVPYQQSAGDGATSVAFKHAALSLEVTPVISPDNSVVVDVAVSRDTPNYSNAIDGVPPIDTNHLNTVINVPHGKTVVLGGVYSDVNHYINGSVPYLSNIPVIGNAFRNSNAVKEKAELLIFLTPRIVGLPDVIFDIPDYLQFNDLIIDGSNLELRSLK